MKVIAKNFRGFKDVLIDTRDNIFLVGDNSSGKTSLLHLIDYVCSTDLYGRARLNDRFNVNSTDFFSPYFEYADVTIGYQAEVTDALVSRVVTIRRDASENEAITIKATYSIPGFMVITRLRSGMVEAQLLEGSEVPSDLEAIVDLHIATDDNFQDTEPCETFLNESQTLFAVLQKLAPSKLNEVQSAHLMFSTVTSCRHFGPMRARPANFYRFDRRLNSTGSHFATMLRDLTQAGAASTKSIKKFGRESGLFDDFSVKRVSTSVGQSPLIVTVSRHGKKLLLNQVGIGVSQIAPIIVETSAMANGFISKHMILIEQPELHLHPVAQAALGEYFYSVSQQGVKFVLETHSDYLIDRYRSKIRETKTKPNAAIYYCYNTESGNFVSRISIDENGKLIDPPPRYHEFFLKEINRTMF